MPVLFRSLQRSSRFLASLALLALLQACASQPQMSASGEAHRYRQHARRHYEPPGTPDDPWGPYVREASAKFDLPEPWIRAVMRQESGGNLYRHGDLITSNAGAMGLMQVMPDTYDELRARYVELGDDPFDPHDNIIAGSAYLREMYDIYGSPGFLAAYNAGPGRLDDYLTRNRPLPAETRRYVAAISPRLAGDAPRRGSPGAQYAMNRLPAAIPAAPRYPDQQLAAFVPPPGYTPPYHPEPVISTPSAAPAPVAAPVAVAMNAAPAPLPEPQAEPAEPPVAAAQPLPVARPAYTPPPRALVQIAELPDETLAETPRRVEAEPLPPREPYRPIVPARPISRPAPMRYAASAPSRAIPLPPALPSRLPFQMASESQRLAPSGRDFHLISPAMAEPVIGRRGGPSSGNWAIQVGAFASSNLAAAAASAARDEARSNLSHARGSVTQVRQGRTTLYRARLQGLSHDGATEACERLSRQRTSCMVVSPDAQS